MGFQGIDLQGIGIKVSNKMVTTANPTNRLAAARIRDLFRGDGTFCSREEDGTKMAGGD